jgi:hypothetical protein
VIPALITRATKFYSIDPAVLLSHNLLYLIIPSNKRELFILFNVIVVVVVVVTVAAAAAVVVVVADIL